MYEGNQSVAPISAGNDAVRKAVVIPVEAEQNYSGPDMASITTTTTTPQPVPVVRQSGVGKRRKRGEGNTENKALQELLKLKLAQYDVFNEHKNIRSKNGSYLPFTDLSKLLEFAVKKKLSAIKQIPQGIEDFAYWLVRVGVTPSDIPNQLLANTMTRIKNEVKLFKPQNVEQRKHVKGSYITEPPSLPQPHEEAKILWDSHTHMPLQHKDEDQQQQQHSVYWHEIFPSSSHADEQADNLHSLIRLIDRIPIRSPAGLTSEQVNISEIQRLLKQQIRDTGIRHSPKWSTPKRKPVKRLRTYTHSTPKKIAAKRKRKQFETPTTTEDERQSFDPSGSSDFAINPFELLQPHEH